MLETLLEYFQNSPLASVWGPFFVLILCGLGLPIPEDIVLIAAGALGTIEGRSWIYISALMYAGVMAGDSTIFFAGRYLGGRLVESRWFQKLFPDRKHEKVEQLFEKYGSTVLFLGRFLPGLRAPIFFTAGTMKVRYWKFFLFDGLAALISVPFFVWLGHWLWLRFSDNLPELERIVSRTKSYWLLGVGVVVVIAALYVWRREKRRKAQATEP
jgi:membrane protein DedA with SNARE-associated domain